MGMTLLFSSTHRHRERQAFTSNSTEGREEGSGGDVVEELHRGEEEDDWTKCIE